MRGSSSRFGLFLLVAVGATLAGPSLPGGGFLGGSPASAQFVPRHCGMRAGGETYGQITVGSTIVLGRHTPWAGDANWDAGMEPYVGMAAVVTQLAGVDTAGCPGVRVSADGQQWFWRIRDAQLAGGGYVPPPPPPPPADPIPRYCGMAAGSETFGVIRPGTQIILGRHTAWGGDANWTDEMNRWVGMIAVVTSLESVDAAGCPVVRVNADGGQYYWRIRDAQLAGYAPPPPPMAIPTWCGMPAGAEQYGPITVGSWVILGVHSPWNGDTNWAPEMMRWVGQRAQVTQLAGVDTVGCPTVRVTSDGGQYVWRIRDMRM